MGGKKKMNENEIKKVNGGMLEGAEQNLDQDETIIPVVIGYVSCPICGITISRSNLSQHMKQHAK